MTTKVDCDGEFGLSEFVAAVWDYESKQWIPCGIFSGCFQKWGLESTLP